MDALHRAWRPLALVALMLLMGVAAPLHVLAAHGALDGDHRHATCGVCFTLSGADNPPVCGAPSPEAGDRAAALPADEAPASKVSPQVCDPTRGPPSLLA